MMVITQLLMLPLQVLLSDGTVWAWGSNYYGQLGLGIESQVQAYLISTAHCAQYPPSVCRVLLVKPARCRSDQQIQETPCKMVSSLLMFLFSFWNQSSSSSCCCSSRCCYSRCCCYFCCWCFWHSCCWTWCYCCCRWRCYCCSCSRCSSCSSLVGRVPALVFGDIIVFVRISVSCRSQHKIVLSSCQHSRYLNDNWSMVIAVTSPLWFRSLLSKKDLSLTLQPVYITGLFVIHFWLCVDVWVNSEPCFLELKSQCAYHNDVSSYAIAECFGTGFYNNGQSLDHSFSNTSRIFANKVRLLSNIISYWCSVVLLTRSK